MTWPSENGVKTRNADSLCCCEYIDKDGERNHVVQCLCNCKAVDEIVERLITCKQVPSSLHRELAEVIEDRMRFPWPGGACKIPLRIFRSFVLLPASLTVIATCHLTFSIVVFSLFALLVWKLLKMTEDFAVLPSLLLSSLLFVVIVFQTVVVPYLEILALENFVENMLIFLGVVLLVFARLKTSTTGDTSFYYSKWICCRITNYNYWTAISGFLSLGAAFSYTAHLMLTTICHPGIHAGIPFLVPDDCSDVYEDFYTALAFVCAIHSILCGTFMFYESVRVATSSRKRSTCQNCILQM